PWCSASWSCYGYSGATTISCGQGLAGLTLTRQESGPCPGACPYDLVPNPTTGQVTNAFVDYYAPVPGTSISYKVIAQDWGGPGAVPPAADRGRDRLLLPPGDAMRRRPAVRDHIGRLRRHDQLRHLPQRGELQQRHVLPDRHHVERPDEHVHPQGGRLQARL